MSESSSNPIILLFALVWWLIMMIWILFSDEDE